MVDRQIAIGMYQNGYSLVEIGHKFLVTKQRVWQILQPFYRKSKTPPKKPIVLSSPKEAFVLELLSSKGIKATPQGYDSLFNFLIKNKKVGVRICNHPCNLNGHQYYRFTNLLAKIEMDFYILLAGRIPVTTIYILPKERARNTINIPINPTGRINKKWSQYREAWHLLK